MCSPTCRGSPTSTSWPRCSGRWASRSTRGTRPDELVVTTPAEVVPEAPDELVERMRASVVVLGPLLARCGRATCPHPAATTSAPGPSTCTCTPRGMGAGSRSTNGNVEGGWRRTVDGRPRLIGSRVVLEYPSHRDGQRADGRHPGEGHHRDRKRRLRAGGAGPVRLPQRDGGPDHRGGHVRASKSRGSTVSHPATHTGRPRPARGRDLPGRGRVTGGEVVVEDGRPEHMEMLIRKLDRHGGRDHPRSRRAAGRRQGVPRASTRSTSPPCPIPGSPPTTSRSW